MKGRAQTGLKRGLDVALSLTGLVVLFPAYLAIAAAMKCAFAGPVFFRQSRPGKDGRLFTILKFRTMRDDRTAGGGPLPDGARLTSLGRFLRRTSLDELPELWNVLRGEMSLVGPRPLMPQYLGRYTLEQARRHEVKPGITGWAQVNGRNAITWEQKFAHDVWYVDHLSLMLDLKILALTAAHVIRREGINQPGFATAGEFMGSAEGVGKKER
jgi:sugar transferase EpsL